MSAHAPRLDALPTWLLAQAAARSHRVLHDGLARAGVGGYEHRVLVALADLGESSQVALGRAAALDRRDVTHTVRALEARGLLARRPSPADARVVLVSLTKAGRRTVRTLDKEMARVQDEVLAPLGRKQRRRLVELLRLLAREEPVDEPG